MTLEVSVHAEPDVAPTDGGRVRYLMFDEIDRWSAFARLTSEGCSSHGEQGFRLYRDHARIWRQIDEHFGAIHSPANPWPKECPDDTH